MDVSGTDEVGHEVIRRDAKDARGGVGSHKEKGPVGPVSLYPMPAMIGQFQLSSKTASGCSTSSAMNELRM